MLENIYRFKSFAKHKDDSNTNRDQSTQNNSQVSRKKMGD